MVSEQREVLLEADVQPQEGGRDQGPYDNDEEQPSRNPEATATSPTGTSFVSSDNAIRL